MWIVVAHHESATVTQKPNKKPTKNDNSEMHIPPKH